jgi:NAD(P)-dependent dehydrogenase (short-subunit alcohol dehydrogenase family)
MGKPREDDGSPRQGKSGSTPQWGRRTLLLAGAGIGASIAAALVVRPGWAQSPDPPAEGSMKGKTALITGSTDGLGREVARRCAALGAHVIVHGRNRERGTAVVEEIARAGKGSARFYAADLGSLDQVRNFAAEILRDYQRLDVLVNNAGVWVRDRQVSADGHELQFAVNYLAGFLLTRELLPLIVRSAPSRIVNVASGAQSPIDFGDVMLERPGRAAQGYGQSKLAQIMFTFDLAQELAGKNVTVATLHPATMMDTTMVRESGMPAQSSVDEGAQAVMHLVAGSGVRHGEFYDGTRPTRAHRQAYDQAVRAQLRALSMELTGLK